MISHVSSTLLTVHSLIKTPEAEADSQTPAIQAGREQEQHLRERKDISTKSHKERWKRVCCVTSFRHLQYIIKGEERRAAAASERTS